MDARALTLEISVLSLIARKLSLETSTVTRQLESSLWKLQRSLWCLYCFLSGLKCSLSSLNAPMAVLPLTFRSFPRSFVARGRRWMLLCVRRRNQQRATRVCLRLASPEGNSTAQDWHNVAERIAHVNEEGTWVNWTKRPKDTGIREWYVHGKQEEMLRTLLESGANAQTVWREQ